MLSLAFSHEGGLVLDQVQGGLFETLVALTGPLGLVLQREVELRVQTGRTRVLGEGGGVDMSNVNVGEYIMAEIVLGSGAGGHVTDRIDAPGHVVTDSDGSRAG